MITAVDTSVLFDFLLADPAFGAASGSALRRAPDEGRLVACGPVWVESWAGIGAASLGKALGDLVELFVDAPLPQQPLRVVVVEKHAMSPRVRGLLDHAADRSAPLFPAET